MKSDPLNINMNSITAVPLTRVRHNENHIAIVQDKCSALSGMTGQQRNHMKIIL